MATLNSTLKLFVLYMRTADKVISKTDQAINKILKANDAADKLNTKLEATGASASNASSGLGEFLSIKDLIPGALKGMNIADEYANTSASLGLITDSFKEQEELQNKIFAAANRSKGSYTSLAGAISKMGSAASEAFSSNGELNTDELVAFTELVQKGIKLGGASSAEQSSSMLQVTQAMGEGKLQGDGFQSIMNNAPMIADAIAKCTGKTKDELEQMSSDGELTSNIIKNAMFMAAKDINAKFETMPTTFSDVWNNIKNGGLKAFGPVIEKVNSLIKSDGFQNFVNILISGFTLAADAAGWLIDTVINGWDIIGPVLAIIAGVYLISMITNLWAMIPPLVAQAAAWLSIYWPILVIVGAIALLIAAARFMGASWEDIISTAGGIIGIFATNVYNAFVDIWNQVAAFINFLGNNFRNPTASIQALFLDLAANVIGKISLMAQAIEDILNAIPGVEVDITGGLDSIKDKLEEESAKIKDEAGFIEFAKTIDYMDYSEGYSKGSEIGSNIYNEANDAFKDITESFTNFGGSQDPTVIEGTGTDGKVEVDMSDEDIQYLRDIAEREYINKFNSATLAPNITFTFGDVHKEADVDKVKSRLETIMREEIAMTAEGAY